MFLFSNRTSFAALTPGQTIILPASELNEGSWVDFASAGGHLFFLVSAIDPDTVTVRFVSHLGAVPDAWSFLEPSGPAMTFVKQDFFQVASPALIRMIPELSAALALLLPPPPIAAHLFGNIGSDIANGLAPILAQNQALLQASISAAGSKPVSASKQAEVDGLRRVAGMTSTPRHFLSLFSSLATQSAPGEEGEGDAPQTDGMGLVPPGLPTTRSLDLPSFFIYINSFLNRGTGLALNRYQLSEKTLRVLFVTFDFESAGSIADFHRSDETVQSISELHGALEDYATFLAGLGLEDFATGVRALRSSLRQLGNTNLKVSSFQIQVKLANAFLSHPMFRDRESFVFGRDYPTSLATRITQSMAVRADDPDVALLLSLQLVICLEVRILIRFLWVHLFHPKLYDHN